MALRRVRWVTAGVDDGHEQRAGDRRDLVGTGAAQVHVMDGNRLAQIGERVDCGEFRLGRVAGDGFPVVGADCLAAAEAQVEADGAFAADDVRREFRPRTSSSGKAVSLC